MNPFNWKREHQVAFLVFTFLGVVIGMMIGWLWSPFSHAQGSAVGIAFALWLQYPGSYWPWATFGALIGALGFYGCRLLTPAS